MGGKRANIGDVRTWSGKRYVKTQEGWQYQPAAHDTKTPENSTQHTETTEKPEQQPEKQAEPASESKPIEAPEIATDTSTLAQEEDSTPSKREEVQSPEEKQEEYVNARKSTISNVGKDIKGAARHKRYFSDIKSMKNAELSEITLKALLKQFPINLIDDVTTDNPLLPYVANQILERFPAQPKHENQKEKYLEIFEFVRDRVQELSKQKDLLFTDVINKVQKELVTKIKENRASADYVRGSDDFLVKYVNNTLSTRAARGNIGQDVVDLVDAFKTILPQEVKDQHPADRFGRSEGQKKAAMELFYTEDGVNRIKDLVEGKDLKKVFEITSESKKNKKFNVADRYLKEAKRVGPDTDLNTVDQQKDFLMKSCEMKGVQWGNSVTDDERKHHLEMTANAFKDLADILGLPEKSISFNGKLGLAIGARGHGTAMAHYESDEVVINLTRAKGVGSLAHEWGHFLDNILAKTHNVKAHADNEFLSEASYWNMGDASPVKEAMKELIRSEVFTDFKNSTRQALIDLMQMGIKEKAEYWMSPRELFARAFEAHISYKLDKSNRENTYLSGGSEGLMWCTKEQKEAFAPYFDKLIEAFRESDHIQKAIDLISDLTKHDFSKNKDSAFHGWINPEGQYHKMGAEDGHLEFIRGQKLTYPQAIKLGWISVGHGGDHNAGIHKDVITQKLHPAMTTLRKLLKDHATEDEFHIDVHGHTEPKPGWSPLYSDKSYRVDPDLFSKHGLTPKSITQDLTYGDLAANENTITDLMKGSFQRRNPFNPVKDVSPDERHAVEYWQGSGGERHKVPEMSEAVKKRALRVLHKKTDVRRHPETGERMFLLHRGVSDYENKKGKLDSKSSWTPDYKVAARFATQYLGAGASGSSIPKPTVWSAWIPESAIHHIPAAVGDSKLPVTNKKNFKAAFEQKLTSPQEKHKVGGNTFRSEHEIIVKPHDLIFAKPTAKQPTVNTKINRKFNDSLEDKSKYKAKDLEFVSGGKYGEPNERRNVYAKYGGESQFLQQKKLAASEEIEMDLSKGSLQSKMGNPKKQISEEEIDKTRNWANYATKRDAIPEATPEAKQRFFHKLHSLTEVRKHPKTGERMFLMHRGVGHFLSRVPHENNLTSWTPDYNTAHTFSKQDDHDDNQIKSGKLYSAWIPESAIHTYINNAATIDNGVNSNSYEQEFIVKPHKFIYAKKDRPLSAQEKIHSRINERQEQADTTFGDESTPQDHIREYNKKLLSHDKLAANENTTPDLMKAADEDAVNKLPESHQHLKQPLLDWSRQNIPSTQMRGWYLNHVAKNPEIHDQHKEEIKHHGDMFKQNKELGKIKFNNKVSLEDGLNTLREADKTHQAKTPDNLIKPNKDTTKMIDVGNGWGWYDLGTNQDNDEAQAMGHCGTGHPDCNLWSLRKEIKTPKGVMHQPHVTVEMLDGGIINQIKGKNNEKPHKKYHDAILPLLHSEHVNHIISQGYRPETNFHVGDLDKKHHDDLIAKKPDIHPFEMTDVNQLEQTMEKMPREYRQHLDDWKDMVEKYTEHAQGQGIEKPTHHDIIKQAIDWGNEGDHRFLTKHPSMTGDLLHYLYTKSFDNKAKYDVLKNPNTLPETLVEAVKNPTDNGHVLQAAKHPSLPEDVMRKLAQTPDNYYLKMNLIRNPAIPQDVVQSIWDENKNKEVDGDHEDLLREIAHKGKLTPQMRQEAMLHPSKHVRTHFSNREDLTDDEKIHFSKDNDKDFNYKMTLHKDLPEKAIENLVQADDNATRYSIARHPQLQSKHLKALAENQERIPSQSSEEGFVQNILNHQNADGDVIHTLATNPRYFAYQHWIAKHPKTSPQTLHKLRGSVATSTRGLVARNPNTSPETLHELAQDKHENVRQDVADRQDLNPKTIELLLKDPDEGVRRILLDSHPELKNNTKLAANENTTPDLQKGLKTNLTALGLTAALGLGSPLGFNKPVSDNKTSERSIASELHPSKPILDQWDAGKADKAKEDKIFAKHSKLPKLRAHFDNPEFKHYQYLLRLEDNTLKNVIDKQPILQQKLAKLGYQGE